MSGAIAVRPLVRGAFAAYGTVLERPARAHDAEGPGWRWWAETAGLAVTDRAYGVGFLDLEPVPLRFDWAERHERSEGRRPRDQPQECQAAPAAHRRRCPHTFQPHLQLRASWCGAGGGAEFLY